MVLDSFLEVLKRIWREFDRSNRTGSKEFSGYLRERAKSVTADEGSIRKKRYLRAFWNVKLLWIRVENKM